MEGKFLAVTGLNPAWQKTLTFDKLSFYEVNRATSASAYASGKGINFVRAARNMGMNSKLFQFLGGDTGKEIKKELDSEGIVHISEYVENATRTCTTCLCNKENRMTELIEPSGEISSEHTTSLLNKLKTEIPESLGLALCGTFPPGVTPAFYSEAVKTAVDNNVPVLLDAWKDVLPALSEGPDILKVNLDELKALTGENTPEAALKKGITDFPVKYLAITDGPKKAYLADQEGIWEYGLPDIGRILNPLGAGDTVSAVMLSKYTRGNPPHEAFLSGLAAASASCMSIKCADFDVSFSKKIRKTITVGYKKYC